MAKTRMSSLGQLLPLTTVSRLLSPLKAKSVYINRIVLHRLSTACMEISPFFVLYANQWSRH